MSLKERPRGIIGGHATNPMPYFAFERLRPMIVPKVFQRNVVFIGIMQEGEFIPKATAFIVQWTEHQFYWTYVVTAEHVISGLLEKKWDIWIRFNLTNGTAGEMRVDSKYWKFYPDELGVSDVAVLPLSTDPVPLKETNELVKFDIAPIPLNGDHAMSATRTIIEDKHIGTGDEINIVGLFRSHYGKMRNVPIVRTGNIAQLDGDPVFTKFKGFIDGYLIEARSIGGLSGSPVYVNMPPLRFLEGGISEQTIGIRFYLLGLIHGHFDIADLTADTVAEDGGTASSINAGIGIVVPVEKIIETIQQADLAQQRLERTMQLRKERGATMDFSAVATDEKNPTHREDFTRLLGAAATPKQSDDQTSRDATPENSDDKKTR